MDILVLKNNNENYNAVLSDYIFNYTYSERFLHQFINSYINNLHIGKKMQKSRALVSGGGKKPWRQKGTGRARAGSIRSPLWRGGGKTFAARPQDWSQKVNRKMYR